MMDLSTLPVVDVLKVLELLKWNKNWHQLQQFHSFLLTSFGNGSQPECYREVPVGLSPVITFIGIAIKPMLTPRGAAKYLNNPVRVPWNTKGLKTLEIWY